jgi:RNA recognition motif-containing protein
MTNIFVARLDYGVTQEELKSAFEQYGQVNKVSLAIDKETGKSKGFAFIEMRNNEEAAAAIKGLDGQTMHGRQIAVKQAEDRSNGAPKREFNNNNERKPFVRENREPRDNNSSTSKKEHDDDDDHSSSPEIFIPKPTINKVVEKKKDPVMKKLEDRPKANKMQAYKKSGKQNRYFLDEDDDY